MKFYCAASDEVYEQVRLLLDAAWGNPTPDGLTVTCIEPAATAPHDSEGRPVVAVDDSFVSWEPAASMVPQLIQQGHVTEITREAYMATVSEVTP